MVPNHTYQISAPPQGGKDLLKSVMPCGIEEAILEDKRYY